MEEYLSALTSPQAVVSIVIAISVLLIQPVFISIRRIILRFIMQSPMFIRGFVRWLRLKNMRKLKKIRQNGDEVIFQSVRANTYFILFLGTLAFYIAMIMLGPLKGMNNLTTIEQLILTIPIYILEVIWISQYADVRQLIESRRKLRITSAKRKS